MPGLAAFREPLPESMKCPLWVESGQSAQGAEQTLGDG